MIPDAERIIQDENFAHPLSVKLVSDDVVPVLGNWKRKSELRDKTLKVFRRVLTVAIDPDKPNAVRRKVRGQLSQTRSIQPRQRAFRPQETNDRDSAILLRGNRDR